MNSNNLLVTLTTANPVVTIPFKNIFNSVGSIRYTPTENLLYPCNVWANPASGSSVTIETTFDNVHLTTWPNGTVTSASSYLYTACPGSISFVLVSGASATVGIT